ncbi:hypothetical protein BASA81_006497 [Batrachochytrium salamandrivorans]|nr:hypothetical protein BASA81_006497 [Batrachochytrium salamandrivorans]
MLKLTVCSARLGWRCSGRCFVQVWVEGQGQVWQTRMMCEPFWNESFFLPLPLGEIRVAIKSKDGWGKVSLQGEFIVVAPAKGLVDTWVDFGVGYPDQCCHVCMQVLTGDRGGDSGELALSDGESTRLASMEDGALSKVFARLDEVRKLVYLAGEVCLDQRTRMEELVACGKELLEIGAEIGGEEDEDGDEDDGSEVRQRLRQVVQEYSRDCQLLQLRLREEQERSGGNNDDNGSSDNDEEEHDDVREWKPHFISSLVAFDKLLDFGYVVECPTTTTAPTSPGRTLTFYSYDASAMRAYRLPEPAAFPPNLLLALEHVPPAAPFAVITLAAENCSLWVVEVYTNL